MIDLSFPAGQVSTAGLPERQAPISSRPDGSRGRVIGTHLTGLRKLSVEQLQRLAWDFGGVVDSAAGTADHGKSWVEFARRAETQVRDELARRAR